MYKFVSFDIWGTLIDSNPEFKKQRALKIAKFLKTYRATYNNNSIDELINFVNSKFSILKNEYNHLAEELTLGFSTDDVFDKFAIMVDAPSGSGDLFKQINDETFLEHLPIVKDGVIDALNILRLHDVKIILASNTVFVSQKVMKQALNILGITEYVQHHLSSDTLLVSKPNIKFYYEMYKLVHCPINEAIHVGDNLGTDIVGPKLVGFKTYYVSEVYNTTVLKFAKENYEKI